jgi:hypothetical protein
VGPSGTGKSYCAQLVAHEYEADAIIDDGLLICGNHIMAGISAKRQSTRVGAIRTALFSDANQAQIVRAKLEELAPKRLLILATSEAMARHIARNLDLPEPEKMLNIREVASSVAIARARRARREHGHHVVPAPTVEVKPRFSGTIIEPVRALWRRPRAHPDGRDHSLWVEQSIVRPTFTYLGHFYIANEALVSIAVHCVKLLGYRLERVNVTSQPDGVSLTADLVVPYGVELPTAAREAQLQVQRQLEHMTALNVLAVNLTIKRLVLPGKGQHPSGAPDAGRKSPLSAARLQ